MLRVTSLADMDDRQLRRWIIRLAVVLVAGAAVFTAFYLFDRWRAPTTPIVDQRVAALEQAVRDHPEDIASRGALADTYMAKSRYQDAIDQYTEILASGKADELASQRRGAAYLALERYDLAARDFQRAVDVGREAEGAIADPTLQAAFYGLGQVALRQGRPAEAIPNLESALTIKRGDADTLYLLGTAYAATGETAKAEEALRRAAAFVPIGWADPYTALAGVFAAAGRPEMAAWAGAMADLAAGSVDAAEPRLLALVDGEAAVDAAIGLGLVSETRGDTAAAARWYAQALAKDPGNAAASLGLNRVGGDPAASLPALPTPAAPAGGGDQ